MKLDFSNEKSIYLQIAESIEDDIIRGVIEEETQIPSTNQMAVMYKINPATAGKGINLLVDRGILYKR
ncbi:MAG: GntR family transcriptional regulator, partial [Clostridiaceae bacterium]|nr:GntR family transcriptional regulator [Clostridiaceae bacterium]